MFARVSRIAVAAGAALLITGCMNDDAGDASLQTSPAVSLGAVSGIAEDGTFRLGAGDALGAQLDVVYLAWLSGQDDGATFVTVPISGVFSPAEND